MAKPIQWNDEGESLNAKGAPDGRFRINPIRDAETGDTEWFLSEGPLDEAPAPCGTLDEAKDLAQAISDGPKALGAFEAKRADARQTARAARQSAAKRQAFVALLDDPDILAELRVRLGGAD